MTKIEKKKGGISSLVLRLGLAALAAYLVVGMVFNQVEIAAKRQQLEAVEQQLEAQQAQNDELSRILQSGTDEEIVERVARDQLGYAKPNERVFVDMTGQ